MLRSLPVADPESLYRIGDGNECCVEGGLQDKWGLRQSVSGWLRVIGRLRPGATTAGMSARLTGMLRRWLQYDAGYPAAWLPSLIQMLPKQIINVAPAGGGVAEMKEDYSRSLHILLTVCCLVLLIACANIANLLLASGMARRSRTSLRLAVGASRGRLAYCCHHSGAPRFYHRSDESASCRVVFITAGDQMSAI